MRALALAEQRLTEAAAELARRGAALQHMEQQRDLANAQVQSNINNPFLEQGYSGSCHAHGSLS